ncbi:MAG: hypothetical protein MRERC_14c030 [Mycoplasmataceae bacterium RC_NB112A]|nr:MAG: hypothetical protein MRERC_14c030 [Mycoplasmataceae bacterium RC_NB112A]
MFRKITAAVEQDYNAIVISKENSSEYQNEVSLSIQAKVKNLYEVENHQELRNVFLNGL